MAVAVTLALMAFAVNRLLRTETPGGWFVYESNSEPMYSPTSSDGEKLREAAVWLAAISLWFTMSWQLFRHRQD